MPFKKLEEPGLGATEPEAVMIGQSSLRPLMGQKFRREAWRASEAATDRRQI